MKKVMVCIALISIATACDNGDMIFENLNFDGKEIQKCENNELYFKTNNSELLLVDFNRNQNSTDPNVIKSWLSPTATLNQVNELITDNNLKIVYRTYDASINKNSICSLLAPANPKVTSEYTSVPGGKIKYVRTINPAVNEGSVNVGYMYTISFDNITLSNGSAEIKYTTLPYGSYIYDNTLLSFNFNTNFMECVNSNSLVGNGNNREIIQLNLPENFEFPTTNQTNTININASNSINYLAYQSPFNTTVDVCDAPSEQLKENWLSESGRVEIITTVINNTAGQASEYKHEIKIVEASFTNNGSSFILTDKIIGNYVIDID